MNKTIPIFLTLLFLSFSSFLYADCDLESLGNSEKFQTCEKLAHSGDAQALWKLGLYYEQSSDPVGDPIKAFRLIERSANLGNAIGQYHLGRYYDYGIAPAKNAFEAVKWYEKSAQQNQTEAFNALGKVYFEGRGVTVDYPRARRWFSRAADNNNETGRFYTNLIDAYGSATSKNHKKAFQFLLQAAETQNVDAWYYLGMLYLQGKGIDVDNDKALYWLKKAAEQKHSKAISEFSQLSREVAKKNQLPKNAFSKLSVPSKPNSEPPEVNHLTDASTHTISPGSMVISILIIAAIGALAIFLFRQKDSQGNEIRGGEAELVREAEQYVRDTQPANRSENIPTKQTSENPQSQSDAANKDFYDTGLLEQARQELETNKLDKVSWQQAINEANGDHARAELLYLKFRVKQLQT